MIDKIPLFLNHLVLGNDGIFGSANFSASQATEHNFREDLARSQPRDYLREVSNHHSIKVMDREVERFISQVPNGGVVCDVGGCWGWHWRR
jgi:hypothetical protein